MQSSEREFTLYIRRCHVCDALNEDACESQKYGPGGSDPSIQCDRCGKFLAPFVFCYPAELKVTNVDAPDFKDQEPTENDKRRKKPIYPPLIGLAIYW